MKTSFIAFCKRNLALANLGIVTNLEYRFNFIIDAFVQPLLTVGIEVLLWLAIFKTAENGLIGGFDQKSYLTYATWAPFFGRISISWMYEAMMVEEVSSGSINAILSRPISFFEYYLSQLMGYKLITTLFSLLVPLAVSYYFGLSIDYSRLPIALLLIIYYLVLIHIMSFIISTLGFYLTRVKSFTILKNLCLLFLSGELVPIDLMPKWLEKIFLALPFSSGVYIPLAYISNRIDYSVLLNGFFNVTWAIAGLGLISGLLWKKGIREYTGTGA